MGAAIPLSLKLYYFSRKYHGQQNRYYSTFCDAPNLALDVLLLVICVKSSAFVAGGPILMLVGTVLIIVEVYVTFIYITAGHSFFSEADKVSIFGSFCYFVLMIITGGMIEIFERYNRLKSVMVFVTLLQLGILIFLGYNLVVVQEHRPVHAKIVLKKKFKAVSFNLREKSC